MLLKRLFCLYPLQIQVQINLIIYNRPYLVKYFQINNIENHIPIYSMSYSDNQDNQFPSDLEINQKNQTLNKIANFLQMKNILIEQFWQSNRNYASPQDIQKFCQLNGLKLSIHDQINLKNQIFVGKQVISIYEFCQNIPQWKRNGQEMIGEFLKHRSDVLVENLNSKHKNQRIKSTINKTSMNFYSRPKSGNLLYSTGDIKQGRLFSASKQSLKQYKPTNVNNSKKYLQQNRLKNLKKEQQLAQTIQKTKNQHQYSMLMKMKELNEFNHKNKSTITYRAYKNAEGVIKVRTFDLQSFKKQLTIQQFESQYKMFKKSTKENKQWERPMSMKLLQSNHNDYLSNTLQSTGISKNQKKEDRQKELKNLLDNTVKLTKLLQEQIKILKMKGIYGCENL